MSSGPGRTADVLDSPPSPARPPQAPEEAAPRVEGRPVEERRDDRTFARGEWQPYLAVTALTGLVVFVMLRLWRAVWNIPFYYSGDALTSGSLVKTTLQFGWYEYQPDLGAPYGQRYHDFPFSDNGSLVVVKALSPFVRDWPTLFNVYYVLCFFLIAWAALWFLRRAGVSRVFSVVLAVLYAVAPYHFMRNENHYFLSAYFTAPLALGVILDVMRGDPLWTARAGAPRLKGWLTGRGAAYAVLLVVVGTTVAYYAVFAGVLLGAAALAALVRTRSWRRFAGAVVAGLVLLVTMFVNLLPDLLYARQNGPNAGALARSHGEVEVYSLKLTSLLMPSAGHPIAFLARARELYDQHYPLPSEQPSLGVIASVSLVGLLALALRRVAQGGTPEGDQPTVRRRAWLDPRRDSTMAYLSFQVVVAFLFATTGGLASIISFATDIIRGWNRMSIFMSALLLAAAGVFLMAVADRLGRRLGGAGRRGRSGRPARRWVAQVVAPVLATMLLLVGVADQSVAGSVPDYTGVAVSWNSDRAFVHDVEARLSAGGMVFQLPFIGFPETPTLNSASNQDTVSLSLHSTTLRWSGGGLKGRPQTDWPSAMAKESPGAAARDLAEMGFSGIVVDRAATTDRGKALEAAFAPFTGPVALSSPNGRYALLSLQTQVAAVRVTTTPQERQSFTDRVLLGRR